MSTALSRRSFLRFAGGASAAVVLPFSTESRLARAELPKPASALGVADRVMINSNENPLGPSAAARAAISDIVAEGGRYLFDLTDELTATFADAHGLKHDYVLPYAGSSEPLQYVTIAFTSKSRSLVTANPTYEAAWDAAALNGAKVHKVLLRADHAHDLRAMVAADAHAGLIYVCNPNNPTGTITPRAEIEWALAHKPKGSILLVDEAYIQFTDERSLLDLVAANQDLVVLHTFSKLYGMAGIRCGFAAGRPDLLKRIALYGSNPMPVTAVAGAIASLREPALIAERKRLNDAVRNDTLQWLAANGYKATPGVTNCFMIDTGRPGKQVIAAMAERGVFIGRTWSVAPNQVRITVGTQAEMDRFKLAFKAVMDAPVQAVADEIEVKPSRHRIA